MVVCPHGSWLFRRRKLERLRSERQKLHLPEPKAEIVRYQHGHRRFKAREITPEDVAYLLVYGSLPDDARLEIIRKFERDLRQLGAREKRADGGRSARASACRLGLRTTGELGCAASRYSRRTGQRRPAFLLSMRRCICPVGAGAGRICFRLTRNHRAGRRLDSPACPTGAELCRAAAVTEHRPFPRAAGRWILRPHLG